MILNSINFNPIVNFQNIKAKTIGFTSNSDSFERTSRVKSFQFTPEISITAKKQLLSQVSQIAKDDTMISPLGYGATGVVYHLKGIDGIGVNGAVAKFSYTEDKNPLTGDKQKVGYDYQDEITALKKVKQLGDSSQQYLGKLKLTDGRNVLLTTYVTGRNPDLKVNPLTKESLSSAVSTLSQLDSINVLHRDLKKENIIIDSESNIKLIDYGEAIDFDFLDEKKCDSELNFPSFVMPSNAQNFEDTFLSPYIAELKEQDELQAREFYEAYLNQKAMLIYEPTAKRLTNYLYKNEENLSVDDIQRIYELVNYQEVMSEVLSKHCNDEIVDIELIKNQVTYMSELAYKNEILLANPLANVAMKANAVICAKKMEAMVLKALNRPNKPIVNQYLKYQLEIAKYRQNKISGWLSGFVGWLCTCATTDMVNADENKMKLINDCLKPNLENFDIPNIAEKGINNEDK